MSTAVRIEIAVAVPEKQVLSRVSVAPGTTARHAISHCGLADEFADIDFSRCPLGVWGKRVADDYTMSDGDRLEVYRALDIDPRDARRELARQGRVMGRAPGR